MLAPILPSPIAVSSAKKLRPENRTLRQGLFDRFRQLCEIALYVFAQMHAQGSAAALRKHGKITTRLRGLDDPESVLLPWDGEIGGVIAGNLEKDAGIGTALVGLAGGMKEPRAKAKAGGASFGVAHLMAHALQSFFVRVVHLDVAEEGEVIARADAAQMRAESLGEVRAVLEGRGVLFVGKEFQALVLEEWSF